MTIQVAFQRIKLFILQTICCITDPKKYESVLLLKFNITTTPEIICDVFSFLSKDQIERVQPVSKFWNNVIIRHKNILPLRRFSSAHFTSNQLITSILDFSSYIIYFDGTNLQLISQIELFRSKVSKPRYSHLTVDEVLKNLNDVIFSSISIMNYDSEDRPDDLLNMMKLVTTKTGGRFRGISGHYVMGTFDSKLAEIFDNYIIVDVLAIGSAPSPWFDPDSHIRKVCANPEIVQLPSTPKEIRLTYLGCKETEEILHFTCNGKLNGANRLTIKFVTTNTYYGNFIFQWFELYHTHQNPISLVGKFKIFRFVDSAFDGIKTFLNNTQLRVKYSLETKEFHRSFYVNQYVKRSCVLHETDFYALVIEMEYEVETKQYKCIDISSINASDLDQPPCNKMKTISFCVKSL